MAQKDTQQVFEKKRQGIYARYIKRGMDFILSLIALVILSPLLLLLTITGIAAMKGNPFLPRNDLVKMRRFLN